MSIKKGAVQIPVEYVDLLSSCPAGLLLKDSLLVPRPSKRFKLLKIACKQGVARAYRVLKDWLRSKPTGEVKFYMENERSVVLTDGKLGFKYKTTFPVRRLNLPENIYVEPTPTAITLTEAIFRQASKEPELFLILTRWLKTYEPLIDPHRIQEIVEMFARDIEKAFMLLNRLEEKLNSVRRSYT